MIDSIYGITFYEEYNGILRGDSVRYCGSVRCQLWIEDFYTGGELLHKGFYVDGKVHQYKNFYPDGTLEREFKGNEGYKASAKLYYPNGKLKSEVNYFNGEVTLWIDYNEEGIVVFTERFTKKRQYEYLRFFYENGSPEKTMELTDKKKRLYSYTEYYASGKIKAEGTKLYDESRSDYVEQGNWKFYDENGQLTREQNYLRGEKVD